jgi:hypothetical protein
MDDAAVRAGRRWAVALGLAVAGGAAVAVAASGDPPDPVPASWKPFEADLPAGVEVWRSGDRRCSVSTITGEGADLDAGRMGTALRKALPAAGVELGEGDDEPMAFSGGAMLGELRLRELAAAGEGDPTRWQLQACFYRKRDDHVCRTVCEKLLR